MYNVEYRDFLSINDHWDVAFFGTHTDERDLLVKKFLKERVYTYKEIEYDLEELCLIINSKPEQIHELSAFLGFCSNKRVILDATSMTVAELYLLAKHLFSIGVIDFEVIYAEPYEYTKIDNDFLLSDSGIGFAGTGIPTLSIPINIDERKHVIFLLGYEGDRFADAMEVMQLQPEDISLFFGVPSYKLNWEKNSYFGNLKIIQENRLNDRFVFCGANNPMAVSRELKNIVKFNSNKQIYIAPIGTKPQAIGCIPSICNIENSIGVGLLWDHPKRKNGRTKGISKISISKQLFD